MQSLTGAAVLRTGSKEQGQQCACEFLVGPLPGGVDCSSSLHCGAPCSTQGLHSIEHQFRAARLALERDAMEHNAVLKDYKGELSLNSDVGYKPASPQHLPSPSASVIVSRSSV